jgi:hypothetical protein
LAKKQSEQNHNIIVISLCHVAVPNGYTRLSRAIDILLKLATENIAQSKYPPNPEKGEPPCQVNAKDALPNGSREKDSHGEK